MEWLTGAERVKTPHTGGTQVGGAPKMGHHITTGGGFDFLKGYLVHMGFEPHFLCDPVSGRIAQFIPLSRSAYAMKHTTYETNRQGSHHIQIEWCWNTMHNLTIQNQPKFHQVWSKMLAVARYLKIPDVFPFGGPTAQGRDENHWSKGGHANHFNAPGNDHSDGLPTNTEAGLWTPSPNTHPITPKPVKPAPKPGLLSVDGDFGKATVDHLQKSLNSHRASSPALGVNGAFDTNTRKALQRYLGVTADGDVGSITVKALQKHLTRVGFAVAVDGSWGKITTEALQKALNASRF